MPVNVQAKQKGFVFAVLAALPVIALLVVLQSFLFLCSFLPSSFWKDQAVENTDCRKQLAGPDETTNAMCGMCGVPHAQEDLSNELSQASQAVSPAPPMHAQHALNEAGQKMVKNIAFKREQQPRFPVLHVG